ncbi:hypothetical protein ACLIKD_18420 [Azonexus sp. IMCC34842]|uniref:hypothetical protein n=1 Tax=Azonexus sp. IMCC34842 TaxID=3420950 RepID=UPI003D0C9844
MSNEQLSQKYLSLSILGFAWLIYGLATAFCLSHGHLREFSEFAYDNFGKFIPSVNRIERLTNLDVALAKGHASLMLASIPLLFGGFLFCDVENSVSGIRKKGKETIAVVLLIVIASGIFIAGFNHSIGRNNFAKFSLLSTLITGISAYCYRLAFCIATKK